MFRMRQGPGAMPEGAWGRRAWILRLLAVRMRERSRRERRMIRGMLTWLVEFLSFGSWGSDDPGDEGGW